MPRPRSPSSIRSCAGLWLGYETMAETFIFSFRPRFVNPIRAGLGLPDLADVDRFPPSRGLVKRQTIRAERKDGKRPKPGDELHLFTGMRQPGCLRIVPRQIAFVREVGGIILHVGEDSRRFDRVQMHKSVQMRVGSLDEFAHGDGFADWDELRAFWAAEHKGVHKFAGFITLWQYGPP